MHEQENPPAGEAAGGAMRRPSRSSRGQRSPAYKAPRLYCARIVLDESGLSHGLDVPAGCRPQPDGFRGRAGTFSVMASGGSRRYTQPRCRIGKQSEAAARELPLFRRVELLWCYRLHREEADVRVPTEAEWEYACRAGTTTRYYSGDDSETLAKVGNVADATYKAKFPKARYTIKSSDGYVFTSPVGSFKPNAFGLHDMHGNAWQWCSDWYDADYYAKSPADDPTGPHSGNVRVGRGGSWFNRPDYSRSANRGWNSPINRSYDSGFRIARTQ